MRLTKRDVTTSSIAFSMAMAIIEKTYSQALCFMNFSDSILDAICFIDANVGRSPGIEETAAYVGFSPSHFSRIFKENVGVTYSAYLTSASYAASCKDKSDAGRNSLCLWLF